METPTENGQAAQNNGTPSFVDTPVKAAKRRAFDSPTQANLDALIDAVRMESRERLGRPSTAEAVGGTYAGEAHPTPPPAALHERRSDMTTDDQRALDNIPEFYEEALRMPEPPAPTPTVGRTCDSPQYPLAEPEYVRHGEAMFRLGVIEGLRLARAAVQHDKHEMRALRLWDGLNAAVSAIDSALATYIQKARSDRNGE